MTITVWLKDDNGFCESVTVENVKAIQEVGRDRFCGWIRYTDEDGDTGLLFFDEMRIIG